METLTSSYFWLALVLVLSLSTSISAQHLAGEHTMAHEASGAPQWEGSPDGIAYSEFNHHIFAAFVLLIGLSELRAAFAPSVTGLDTVRPAAGHARRWRLFARVERS